MTLSKAKMEEQELVQEWILAELNKGSKRSIELAMMLNIPTKSMAGILWRMEEKGLVRKIRRRNSINRNVSKGKALSWAIPNTPYNDEFIDEEHEAWMKEWSRPRSERLGIHSIKCETNIKREY